MEDANELINALTTLREICDRFLTFASQVFDRLARSLRPGWTDSDIFEATTKLIHSVSTRRQLESIITSHLPDNKSIELFLVLHSLRIILSSVSCSSLCTLSSTVPTDDPLRRLNFIKSLQERFQQWSNNDIESLKSHHDSLPSYQRHAFLQESLAARSNASNAQLSLAIESLFQFSPSDLLQFKLWFESLDDTSITIIANLFQFTEDEIITIWTFMNESPSSTHSASSNITLQSSQDGWPNLNSSIAPQFPLNASDDYLQSHDWMRLKKRTAGGTAKHIINLADSSSGVTQLRLSSSLNAFVPSIKRGLPSVSPNAVHEIQLPSGSSNQSTNPSSSHLLQPHSNIINNTVNTNNMLSLGQSMSFDNMLNASEAPFSSDHLRSSNWPLLPPRSFLDNDDIPSGSASSKDGSTNLHPFLTSSTSMDIGQTGNASHGNSSVISTNLNNQNRLESGNGSVDTLRNALEIPSDLKMSAEIANQMGGNIHQQGGSNIVIDDSNARFFPPMHQTASQNIDIHSQNPYNAQSQQHNQYSMGNSGGMNMMMSDGTSGMMMQNPNYANMQEQHQPPMDSSMGITASPEHTSSPSGLLKKPMTPAALRAIPVGKTPPSTSGILDGIKIEMRIVAPPPAKSVYQRILRPNPSVKVIGAEKLSNRVLFVKATLWNVDCTEQLGCIEGGLQVSAQPTTAVFRKLKVMNTSVQKGTLFRLKFQLEVFNGPAIDVHVWSEPMEVVSHTVYLTNNSNNNAPTPPNVTEAIPAFGKSGARVAIIGTSFLDSTETRVKFGDITAKHSYHESGTLVAIAPDMPIGSRVSITVSNDSNDYSATFANFTYT